MNAKLGAVLAIIFFAACIFMAQKQVGGWNDSSRLAAIESLVERGTWTIEDSTWVNFTQDKIVIGDLFYSDKMPLFSLIGAGVYWALHAVGGSVRMDCAEVARFCAYAPLTLILVSLPAAILVFLFFDYATRLNAPRGMAVIGTIALGFGTMIFPYALVLNHHVPAAASAFASFYLLSRHGAKPKTPSAATGNAPDANNKSGDLRFVTMNLFFAGLLAALAPSFDVLSGVVAATLFGMAAARYRARAFSFVLGAAVPLLATALLDYQIAHTILPPYTVAEAYNYPGSAFPATVGGNGTPDDYTAYAFRMFLGGKGLFAYNPLLIFAFIGAVRVALQHASALRVPAIFTALGFVFLCVYLATQTGNYGGTAYGERWFVVAIPVLFSFIFFVPPLSAPTWNSAAWFLFLPLFALSVFSSWQGAQSPWQDWLPPLQMTRDVTRFPHLGFRWNVNFLPSP